MAKEEFCYACYQKLPKVQTQTCDRCSGTWDDGIAGCPYCGSGNPLKDFNCTTLDIESPTYSSKKDSREAIKKS